MRLINKRFLSAKTFLFIYRCIGWLEAYTQHPALDAGIYAYTVGAYSVEMNRSDSSAAVDMNITAE